MLKKEANTYLILLALWLLVFSASSQVIIVAPILPDISAALNVAEARLGDLVTAYAVMLAIFAVIVGPISDKIGRRRVLLIGSAMMAAALYLHGVATSYTALLVVRAVAGVAGGMLSGAAVAYVGDYFPYNRRGWANGWVMSGIAAGQILGVAIGKIVAAALGYRWPFIAFAITMTFATLLIWYAVPQPNVVLDEKRLSIKRALVNYGRLLVGRHTGAAVLAYLLMFFSIGFFVIYLSVWLENVKGLTGVEIGLLFAVGGLANLIAGPPAGSLSDRVGRKPLVVLSCLLFGLLMLSTTFIVSGFISAAVLFGLIMVTVSMRISPLQSLMTAIVPDAQRGILMSLAVAVGQGGFALAGKFAGPVYVTYGFFTNTLIGAVAIVLMALLVALVIPEPEGDVEVSTEEEDLVPSGAEWPEAIKAPHPQE